MVSKRYLCVHLCPLTCRPSGLFCNPLPFQIPSRLQDPVRHRLAQEAFQLSAKAETIDQSSGLSQVPSLYFVVLSQDLAPPSWYRGYLCTRLISHTRGSVVSSREEGPRGRVHPPVPVARTDAGAGPQAALGLLLPNSGTRRPHKS